jgi:hypothetical protein
MSIQSTSRPIITRASKPKVGDILLFSIRDSVAAGSAAGN